MDLSWIWFSHGFNSPEAVQYLHFFLVNDIITEPFSESIASKSVPQRL